MFVKLEVKDWKLAGICDKESEKVICFVHWDVFYIWGYVFSVG
jgi:hypothetical protein